jgi:hypothetical protein
VNNAAFHASVAHHREYEIAVSNWLQRRGWLVLPAYDYSGKGESKAPKLLGVTRQLVVPDLLACRGGKSRWFEVKYKTEASETYSRGNRLETGIDLRLWKHYCQVREESGVEVWIVFVHRKEAEVRGLEIEDLQRHGVRESPRFNYGKGGVFFPWDGLQRLATLTEVLAENDYFARQPA